MTKLAEVLSETTGVNVNVHVNVTPWVAGLLKGAVPVHEFLPSAPTVALMLPLVKPLATIAPL